MPPQNRRCHAFRRCRALAMASLLTVSGLLLPLVLLTPGSSAEVEYVDHDFFIDRDDFRSVRIDAINQGSIEVVFQLDDDDQAIDFMLMNMAEYNNYQSGAEQVRYIYGRLDVLAVNMSWQAPDNGTYFVVIDNTDEPEPGAESYYSVTGHILVKIDRPSTPRTTKNKVIEEDNYPWLALALAIVLGSIGTAMMLKGLTGSRARRRAVRYYPDTPFRDADDRVYVRRRVL